mgnify:CR=1 FL=1
MDNFAFMREIVVNSYDEAKEKLIDLVYNKYKFIIVYGLGNNGKTHLISEIDTHRYKVVYEYNDIEDLTTICKDRTRDIYLIELRDSEELSYFQECTWPVFVLNMNKVKFLR